MQRLPEAVCVFLVGPSETETERRLRTRRSEDEDSVRARLERARMEKTAQEKLDYKYLVVNDELDATVERIHQIIESEASERNGR